MNRIVIAGVALVVLVVAAVGVIRELRSGDEVEKAPIATVTAQGGALRVRRAETPRPLPELRFTDGAGAQRSLADFRGRAILLNVWATWCVPCRKEMPALDRVQQTLGGPEFEVVALSIDRDGARAVKDFYAELELRALRIYVDPGGEALTKRGGRHPADAARRSRRARAVARRGAGGMGQRRGRRSAAPRPSGVKS